MAAMDGPSISWRERNTVLALDRPSVVTATTAVWQGGACAFDTADATVRPISAATYPRFAGIALSDVVAGGTVVVRRGFGYQARVLLAGLTGADLGAKVYATTDQDYTLTAMGGTAVGTVDSIDSEDPDYVWVVFSGDTWT